jgi:hypothetical protein
MRAGLIPFLCVLALPTKLYSQSNYFYPNFFTAYFQNMAQVNPSHFSDEGKANFNLGYKSMTGAFRKVSSYYFAGSRTFKKKRGTAHLARLQFYNEKEGSYISSPRVYANYAYQIPLREELRLFFGVALGVASVYYSAPNTTQSSYVMPDGSAGIGIRSRVFELGGAMMQMFSSEFVPVANPVILKNYYHVYASAQKDWANDWSAKVRFLWRHLPSLPDEYYGTASISYTEHATLGATMKYGAGLGVFGEFGINTGDDQLKIFINYNAPFFGLIPAYQSNVEIGLGYVVK